MAKIKNIDRIRAKAKEQITSLLREMKCYNFQDEGIDLWLDTWEKACTPQITKIAEKHPYYDGDCKIVFPAEYPRELDFYQVDVFRNWLRDFGKRNCEESTINGFTYKEASNVQSFNYYMLNLNVHESELNLPNDLFAKFKEDYKSGETWMYILNGMNAYQEFENYRKYTVIRDKAYRLSEFRKMQKIPSNLNEILSFNSVITQFMTRETADMFSEYFPDCRFAEGQKLSRAVAQIGKKYKLTDDPEWEREFAAFANSVNPLMVTKWTVISWHPMDYLTFCFGDSWSSCCTIDKYNVRNRKIGKSRSSITSYIHDENDQFHGEHAAAALSYMFDKSSFIYYTVSSKYEGKLYEEQDKNTRIVFALSTDCTTLLETRLYPQCNDDNPNDTPYRIPREIVQKVICDALDVPNLWKVRKGRENCIENVRSRGVHYNDYADERNKQCNISFRGDEPTKISIGHNAICPECGCVHEHISSLNCWDCDPDC